MPTEVSIRINERAYFLFKIPPRIRKLQVFFQILNSSGTRYRTVMVLNLGSVPDTRGTYTSSTYTSICFKADNPTEGEYYGYFSATRALTGRLVNVKFQIVLNGPPTCEWLDEDADLLSVPDVKMLSKEDVAMLL